jgi:hypothetical protein
MFLAEILSCASDSAALACATLFLVIRQRDRRSGRRIARRSTYRLHTWRSTGNYRGLLTHVTCRLLRRDKRRPERQRGRRIRVAHRATSASVQRRIGRHTLIQRLCARLRSLTSRCGRSRLRWRGKSRRRISGRTARLACRRTSPGWLLKALWRRRSTRRAGRGARSTASCTSRCLFSRRHARWRCFAIFLFRWWTDKRTDLLL